VFVFDEEMMAVRIVKLISKKTTERRERFELKLRSESDK
jgi:hypothetical protein